MDSFQNTRRIFEVLFALHDSGAPFGLAELDARLEEADRSKLASIVLDETNGEEVSLQLGEACVARLRRGMAEARVSALKVAIKEAERAGNMKEALQLCEELDRITKSQSAGDVQ